MDIGKDVSEDIGTTLRELRREIIEVMINI
jgi:hypothetical protein